MSKSLLSRIIDIIDGTPKQKLKESVVRGKTGIDTEEALLDGIVGVFHAAFKGRKEVFADKTFTLWATDQLVYNIVAKPDFSTQLSVKLGDEGFKGVHWNITRIDEPPQNHFFHPVKEHLFLQVETNETVKPPTRKAKISAVKGKGALVKKSYTLNPEVRKKYNIGIGALPDMQGKRVRENHIAIDDNTDSPQYENNKYVSRTHAHIGFSEKYGFYLQVDIGGSRAHLGSRTQVFRGENTPIEVENIDLPVPLQNGDFIVLGKQVMLHFEEIV